jgi:hypothetical protein
MIVALLLLLLANGPSLQLKARPQIVAAPAKIAFNAELKNGTDEEVYCPRMEWDWGDGTTSEHVWDCTPYEPGKTIVLRRFYGERKFTEEGEYTVTLRLYKGNKVLAVGKTFLRILPPFPK